MAMSLDSHVADRGLRPGPGGLKLTPGARAYVPKIPRGEWRRRDCGVTTPLGGDFLLSVSMSLSDERIYPLAKLNKIKKKKKKKKSFISSSFF